jgi:hypothetical protein
MPDTPAGRNTIVEGKLARGELVDSLRLALREELRPGEGILTGEGEDRARTGEQRTRP